MTIAVLTLFLTTGIERPVAFETDIMPILTRSGCNAGACHGAAIGRGGFRLSLYGSNPEADYNSIVHELEGRRVNTAIPNESLIFLKATETIEHGGGTRFDEDDPSAVRLLNWIRSGLPRSDRTLVRFDVTPPSARGVADKPIELKGRAVYDDGSGEDVTDWMVVSAVDDFRTEVQGSAVRPLSAGRHLVTVRYRDRVVPVEVVVPFADVAAPEKTPDSLVDELLAGRLRALGLPVSPDAGDATFVRRTYLALTGRLPTAEQARTFVTDSSSDKHTDLVERLIASDEFTDFFTWRFAELLRIRPTGQEKTGARVYHDWLREQIAANAGYDKIVRELLTSVGDSHEVGPANFHRTVGTARDQAELVSEVLMGVRLRCANCHDHPLDHWKQDDYHGLAAMFVKLDRSRVVKQKTRGEVTHPRTGMAAIPRLPASRFLESEANAREQLADWLVDPENPYFARAIVNRLWKWTMGRGLIEPADDMRATNPAAHPELLDALAADFAAHGFDVRRTVRTICTSRAFRRSSVARGANAGDSEFFSRYISTPLDAQVLMDALVDVTMVPTKNGRRTVLDFDPTTPDRSLDVLGRCDRTTGCDSGGGAAGALPVQLHLLNSRLLNQRLTDPVGRLAQLASRPHDEKLRTLYLVSLSREPRAAEAEFWQRYRADADNDDEFWQDVLWSLLNCEEFLTNH